jgi:hypothetical protein
VTIDRRFVAAVVVIALVAHGARTLQAQAAARTWSNVMYLGGAAGVRGKSLDWDNRLTIAGDRITFTGTGKSKIRFEIATTSVRILSYTGHRHTNDGAAAAAFAAAGLVGLFAGSAIKSTDHYLELGYLLPGGTPAALLLRLHKENQQDIIDALHAATGIAK